MSNDTMLGGLYLLMALMLVLGSLMARREPIAKLATMLLAWIAIFAAGFVGVWVAEGLYFLLRAGDFLYKPHALAAAHNSQMQPAHGLIEAARGADLLVVGSRGTHGAGSLGSVSERVAHEAPCSVLVVRPALPA